MFYSEVQTGSHYLVLRYFDWKRSLQGGLAPGSRLVVLVNLSEATSVSSRTAASLDWVLHLQSLSRARHMSVHTLYQDDSMTVVGNSMAQIPSIFSRQNAATSDQELPPFLAANADSMALKLLEGPNDCSGPVNDECEKDCDKDKLIAEMEQLKAQVQDLLVCLLRYVPFVHAIFQEIHIISNYILSIPLMILF